MPTLRSASKGLQSPNEKPNSDPTTPSKKRSSSRSKETEAVVCSSPMASQSDDAVAKVAKCKIISSPTSSRKRLYGDEPTQKPKWNPKDPVQMKAVKEALHVATVPSNVACRDGEQNRIFDFCKECFEKERAGSLYVCGCPGTGKTLSLQKVKNKLLTWSKEVGYEKPEAVSINCTTLTSTSEIFSKILEKFERTCNGLSPLQQLQRIFSQRQSSPPKMTLIIVDEMDYLITSDRSVLHDLFMLTTLPFSRCILIGIANAIDLADRFLPKLASLNCKPPVITFRAYNKNQIYEVIQERLKGLGYDVFDPLSLEFCARKVAAASGDMRKALAVCRSAVEHLETEIRDSCDLQEFHTVTFDHMDKALSQAFKPKIVDTILSLPLHQQVILYALVNLFNRSKKNSTTVGELNKTYNETWKSIHRNGRTAIGAAEFTNMCQGLSDQGLLRLKQSKEEKSRRITLTVDSSDIAYAFKGHRFIQDCKFLEE
ncbi:Cell division control protein 6-like protein [Rhynchospora pubera]|uniref:Cell division control protein n=1 Tax=Rhynchospora pubera TaxID=906938 RepID=A0AAV8HDS3_9POAL|nr:Cell division control protein 6-like protein [Rhynchospora pubera]